MRLAVVGFCKSAALPSRKLRAILSDLDGIEFVLAYNEDGVYCTEWQEEDTRHLEEQLAAMQRRLDRRRAFLEGLPPRPGGLR